MKDGRKAGIMINEIPFSNFPVLFKQCGLDFYIIDDEHGGFDYREIYGMICFGSSQRRNRNDCPYSICGTAGYHQISRHGCGRTSAADDGMCPKI